MIDPKVLVIIPAFNEEKSIAGVIREVKGNCKADILVVDDGSTDSTAQVALKEGVKVVSLPFNLGIGGAVQTGYIYANENNYDIAVQVDGDGQHDPSYLDELVAPILNEKYDMVIGSRYVQETSYKSTLSRRVGMVFFSWLLYFLTGKRIKDTTSGFRAVNRKIIRYFSSSYPTDYPEVDVIVRLFRKNCTILEVPVEMKERQGGKSSITPLKSIYYLIKVSLALLINILRSRGAL
ncbi:MAG: glycosyltransferase family 2 protein [Clostridiales bacterium]|nr:glycosyltransferase family 2 protein [Eubacteriales bacterium]MDH7567085.1 glycosyltransferase family 2 protein [Clostridiales bacterium]